MPSKDLTYWRWLKYIFTRKACQKVKRKNDTEEGFQLEEAGKDGLLVEEMNQCSYRDTQQSSVSYTKSVYMIVPALRDTTTSTLEDQKFFSLSASATYSRK